MLEQRLFISFLVSYGITNKSRCFSKEKRDITRVFFDEIFLKGVINYEIFNLNS